MACESIVGYSSVYRIQFSMACFFFLMMIIMLGVKRSKDPRSGIQNGYVRERESIEILYIVLDSGFLKLSFLLVLV